MRSFLFVALAWSRDGPDGLRILDGSLTGSRWGCPRNRCLRSWGPLPPAARREAGRIFELLSSSDGSGTGDQIPYTIRLSGGKVESFLEI